MGCVSVFSRRVFSVCKWSVSGLLSSFGPSLQCFFCSLRSEGIIVDFAWVQASGLDFWQDHLKTIINLFLQPFCWVLFLFSCWTTHFNQALVSRHTVTRGIHGQLHDCSIALVLSLWNRSNPWPLRQWLTVGMRFLFFALICCFHPGFWVCFLVASIRASGVKLVPDHSHGSICCGDPEKRATEKEPPSPRCVFSKGGSCNRRAPL